MFKKKIGTVALSFGLVVSAATAASALTYSPDPIPEPAAGEDGVAVHVVSDRTDLPAGNYKVSLCTVTSSALEIPSCLASENDGNLIDNFPGGQLELDISGVKKTGMPNAHHFLQWTKPTFSCDKPGSCEFLIVKHEAGRKTVQERKVAVFE